MILTNTATMAQYEGREVSLQGYITQIIERVSQSGMPFFQVRLSDSLGSATVMVWPSSEAYEYLFMLDKASLHLVEVKGRVVQLDTMTILKMKDVFLISESHCHDLILPRCAVPAIAISAFNWVTAFVDAADASLSRFLKQVFMKHLVGYAFLRSRASGNNHHAYPGGLLVHSVEVAKLVESLGETLGLTTDDIQLAQLLALIHDLGKINTVGEHNPRPVSPAFYKHETQTLLLVSEALGNLTHCRGDYAAVISHVLDRFIHAKNSYESTVLLEDLVRYADYLSAANGVGKSHPTRKKSLMQHGYNNLPAYR